MAMTSAPHWQLKPKARGWSVCPPVGKRPGEGIYEDTEAQNRLVSSRPPSGLQQSQGYEKRREESKVGGLD